MIFKRDEMVQIFGTVHLLPSLLLCVKGLSAVSIRNKNLESFNILLQNCSRLVFLCSVDFSRIRSITLIHFHFKSY